jgi:hypothetical protein
MLQDTLSRKLIIHLKRLLPRSGARVGARHSYSTSQGPGEDIGKRRDKKNQDIARETGLPIVSCDIKGRLFGLQPFLTIEKKQINKAIDILKTARRTVASK